jgi:exodeoxyribonuclease VII large subunit
MAATVRKEERILTVAQTNALVKVTLDGSLPPRLTVVGEISNWNRNASSGHCYFTLKDETSQLPTVMWRSDAVKLKFKPENGLKVLARGSVEVYVPHGRYQLVTDRLEPAGQGALQLAFEQLKAKLEAEGLFDPAKKKRLPRYPFRIGIVTSESAAALQDIRTSIQKRWPPARLFLYPVPVQGEGAAKAIAEAIGDINRRNKELRLDVLIVGRGGGSLEDLWSFNEEAVARAIYASKIPTISAVGHETDFTIADFVADWRASTPTRAAEACPEIGEVLASIETARRHLVAAATGGLAMADERLKTIGASGAFRNPRLAVNMAVQRLDEHLTRLSSSMKDTLSTRRERVNALQERAGRIEPHRLIAGRTAQLTNAANSMATALRKRMASAELSMARSESSVSAAVKKRLSDMQLRLAAGENRLEPLNPRSILSRGYSITRRKDTGKVVLAAGDVQVGDVILTELANQNLVESQVNSGHNSQQV